MALNRLLSDRRGTTTVEFGFVGLIFFMLLLGAVDVGRFQISQQSLRSLTAEAARAALINANQVAAQLASGNTSATPMSADALKAYVTTTQGNPTPFLNPDLMTFSTASTAGVSGVSTVTVTVSYPFEFILPILPNGPMMLVDSVALSF